MRKSRLGWLMGLMAVFAAAWVYAAGSFEGEVDMKFDRKNSNENVIQYFVKGHKARVEMGSKDSKFSGSGIVDWQTFEMITVMDKQKMYMVTQLHPEKMKYNGNKNYKITRTGKTEEILGHRCEEWDYTSDDGNGKIWFASGIGNWWAEEMGTQMDKIPADQRTLVKLAIEKKLFPMRWESTDKSGNENDMEVVKIENKSLSSSLFEPPAGYKKFDMGSLLGGNAKLPF